MNEQQMVNDLFNQGRALENGKNYADSPAKIAFNKAVGKSTALTPVKLKSIIEEIRLGQKTLRETSYGRRFEIKPDAIVEALRLDDKLARGGINDFHDAKIKAGRQLIITSILLRQKTITLTGPGSPATFLPKDLVVGFDSLSAKPELYTAVLTEIKCGKSKILADTTLNVFDQRGRTDIRDGELILGEPIIIDSESPLMITFDAKGIESIAPNTYLEIRFMGFEVVVM